MVPEKVSVLLKNLPKETRKRLMPIGETARRILPYLAFGNGDFYTRLAEAVFSLTGIRIDPRYWDEVQLPEHLKMRFEVVGPTGNVLAAGRNIEDLRASAVEKHEDQLWRQARKTFEKDEVAGLDFGDLPERIQIGTDAMGIERFAWPGLCEEDGKVAVRLFTDPASAAESSRAGLMRLCKIAFAGELNKFSKSWAFPDSFASRVFFMGGVKKASQALYDYILRNLFGLDGQQRPDRKIFLDNTQKLKGRLGVLGNDIRTPVLSAVEQRHDTLGVIGRFTRMAGANRAVIERLEAVRCEVGTLSPPDFLDFFSAERVNLLPRYLRGLSIRAERAYVYPEKDRLKQAQVLVYATRLGEIRKRVLSRPTPEGLTFVEEAAQMVEELKINLFAPEIKTLFPVSGKRIEKKLDGFLS
jgi:ATP-dependent helicase HrpA